MGAIEHRPLTKERIAAKADAASGTHAAAITAALAPSGAIGLALAAKMNVVAEATAANLADVAAAINTTGKTKWKVVGDTTNGKLYFATGTAAAAPWRPFDDQSGTSDVTPA